jgi:hypothetical protein
MPSRTAACARARSCCCPGRFSAPATGRVARRAAGAVAGLLTLLALVGGCRSKGASEKPPLPVRVIRIQVELGEEAAALAVPPVNVAELNEAAHTGLARSGVHVDLGADNKPPEPGDFTLQMEVLLKQVTPPGKRGARADGGAPLLRVLTAGQLRARSSGDALTYEAEVAARRAPELSRLQHIGVLDRPASADKDKDAAAFGLLIRRAVLESAHTLGEQLQLLGTPSPRLVVVVADTKAAGDVRGLAAQLLALRRDHAAVPLLIELLKERDPPAGLRDQAIGALVEIGDRRAVRPLLDTARFDDEVEMGKVVEAVASLGGDEARSYLRFVAASHNSAQIKDEAKAALAHLERREQRADAGSSGP